MPATHIALLRGINVGKAKRVGMAELRAVVQSLGYRNVRTLLNSGNVVFTSTRSESGDAAAARIEQAIAKKLDVTSRVTVISADELAAACAENALAKIATNPSRFLVAVLRDAGDLKKLVPLTKQPWGSEAIALGARVAYIWVPDGILESKIFAALTRALGDGVTTRNWTTMQKLHALAKTQD